MTRVVVKMSPRQRRNRSCSPRFFPAAMSLVAVLVVMLGLIRYYLQSPSLKEKTAAESKKFSNNWNVLSDNTKAADSTYDMTKNNFNLLQLGKLENGYPFLWQKPDGTPRGILFVAHGCQHSMTDWWPPTQEVCPECLGLPEEVAIVKFALQRNLVVVAASSQDVCWSHLDGPMVAQVLEKMHRIFQVPLLLFGASSGGYFCSHILPSALQEQQQLNIPIAGYISQIMAVPDPTVRLAAAVYITMNRDVPTDQAAAAIVKSLSKNKISALHIRLDPLSITTDLFHERLHYHYDTETCSKMVHALREANMLSETGLLREDPRLSDWRSILQKFAKDDSLVADASPLSEVLNVAWGSHEMTRDGVAEALDFLLQQKTT